MQSTDFICFKNRNHRMWCDLWKPVTCRKRWNCKIKEINIVILMFFFFFYSLWTSVSFDTSIRGDPSKKFWNVNNSNFCMIDNSKYQFSTMWRGFFSDHITCVQTTNRTWTCKVQFILAFTLKISTQFWESSSWNNRHQNVQNTTKLAPKCVMNLWKFYKLC